MKFQREITIVLLMLICVFSNVPLTMSAAVSEETSDITFTISIPTHVLSETANYDVMKIPDYGVTTDVGKPMLPVKVLPVLVPPDADIQAIEVTSSNKTDLAGTYTVCPAPPPVREGAPGLPKSIEFDPEIYGSDEPYPGVLFEDLGVQWFQGYKILNIRLFPMQYIPTDGVVTCYSSVSFRVTYTSTGTAPSRNSDEITKEIVSSIVVNPENVDEWVAPSIIIIFPIPYIIITDDYLESTFQRLADWKRHRTGWPLCNVYTTTWIYSNYAGADDAEKIRNFIIDMDNNHALQYVLLAGDYTDVPTRFVYDDNSPTDYYYACLDGDWDPDNDGVYLEPAEPIPDFYPEVYVGRIPVSWMWESNIVIDKIIAYERNPPPGYWRRRAVLAGAYYNYEDESVWGETDTARQCEYVKDDFLTPKSYGVATMYEGEGLDPSSYPSVYDLSIDEVDRQVSGGCLMLGMCGHGSPQEQVRKVWMWDDGDGVQESHEMYWTPFIDTKMTLKNGEQLPLVYIEACLCGKFDDPSDSVAEWLLKMEDGGAIGVVAASRTSWYRIGWDKGDGLNAEQFYLFWEEFFDKTNYRRPGRMLYASKYSYYLMGFDMNNYAHKKNILIYNLIGDPETIIPAQDFIDSKPLAWPTDIDGSRYDSEWGDSEMIYVGSGDNVDFSYSVYAKNDEDWLYMAVDVWGDTTQNDTDYCLIAFDTNHDNTLTTGSEDAVIIYGDGTVRHLLFSESGAWTDIHCSSTSGVEFIDHGRDEAGMIGAVGFYTRQVYEFRIPLILGDLNAFCGGMIGLYVYIRDVASYSGWPADVSWPDPTTYGDLLLAYPYDLTDYPAPFVHLEGNAYLGYLDNTFVVGGTHTHGPFGWGAWTVDVLGGMGISSTLGNEATYVYVDQVVDDDIADYNPATGVVTIQWWKIPSNTLVSIGSGAVNLVSLYYNNTIPYKFIRNATGVYIYSERTGDSYDFGWGYDHAVIALVYEPELGYVLVTFGITGSGSQAASIILQHFDSFPDLLRGKGVIVKWQDVNGDNKPQYYDDFSIVEYYS